VSRIIPHRTAASRNPRLNAESGDALDDERERPIRTDAVYALYTSPEETLSALRVANRFAGAMGVPLTVLHLRSVPYNWPLDAPSGISPIQTASFENRLREANLAPSIAVHLCRDERDAIAAALKPHSLVVVGSNRHWWQRGTERLRYLLEAAGHFVVIAATESFEETSHA